MIRIRHEGRGLFLFSVAEFNEVLASGRAEAEEEGWAYIVLDREWLEEHRVY